MADASTPDPPPQGSVSDSPQTPNRHNATNSSSASRQRRGKTHGHTASHSRSKPPASTNSATGYTAQSALSGDLDHPSQHQNYIDDESQDSSQQTTAARHKKKSGRPSKTGHRKGQASSGVPVLDGNTSPRPLTASTTQTSYPQTSNATPIKQAYAGPTFHASPAASALPMPKFLSKSVPHASATSGLQAQLEQEQEKEDSSGSEGQDQASSKHDQPAPTREESPLDFFFNAHRAEQERQRTGNTPTHIASKSQTSLTPESAERQSFHSASRPASGASRRGVNRTVSGLSGRDLFMMELDGTGETDASDDSSMPSVPFKERMSAARSTSNLAHSQTQSYANQSGDNEAWRMQQSQALKQLLMAKQQGGEALHSATAQTASQSITPAANDNVQQTTLQRGSSLPPAPQSSEAAQFSPNTTPQRQSPSVKDMESNLRRILKLDP